MHKFIAEVIERCIVSGIIANSYEVPVYAKTLDEAVEVIDKEYASSGVEIGRIYQQVNNSEVK